jgi:hypothetical protein
MKRWKSVVGAVVLAGSTLGTMAGVNPTSAAALPPPAPLATATLVGEAGDYVVGANSLSFTTITAGKLYSNGVRFRLQSEGHDLNIWFAPPTSQAALTTAVYDGAVGGITPDVPLLSIFGDGRSCGTSAGRFVVDSISLDADGLPLAFSAQFELHCNGLAPAITGAINYTPPPPRVLPAPTSAGTAVLNGDAGEYVLQGQRLAMTVAKNPFQWSDGSVNLAVTTAGQSYLLTLAPPPGQPWSIGTYERAQRSVFRSPGRPGLDLGGEGRGCNTVSGRFVVDKLVLDASGVPLQLSAQFEFHCEGLIPAIVGSINYGVPAHLGRLHRLRSRRQEIICGTDRERHQRRHLVRIRHEDRIHGQASGRLRDREERVRGEGLDAGAVLQHQDSLCPGEEGGQSRCDSDDKRRSGAGSRSTAHWLRNR